MRKGRRAIVLKLLIGFFLVAAVMIGARPLAAQCPEIEATPWRSAVKHARVIATVTKNYDGDWSAYIARWERQVDTARDIYFRNKALIVRFGKKRKALKGKDLIRHIKGLSNRINAAYCLRGQMMTQADEVTPKYPSSEQANEKTVDHAFIESIGCNSCHGETGISEDDMTPHLAGQQEKYLRNQMLAFASKKPVATYPYGLALRTHKDMVSQTKALRPENARKIAAHYSKQDCPLPSDVADQPPTTPAKVEICIACHGIRGISNRSDIPNLAGQPRNYLVRQLKAFRLTKGDPKAFRFRNRRYHQFMSAIAAPLSNQEMRAMATYYAALPCR